MAKKEFTFRGKNEEELRALSIKEFVELLPSSERRKFKRGFTYVEKRFLEKIEIKDNVKTHAREMIVMPFMIGKTVQIHNGKGYNAIKIVPEMIAHRLGQLVPTRKRVGHAGGKDDKKKKK